MTMTSVFMYFGVFLPVELLKRPPEYEKCNRAEYQELFATVQKNQGDKSFFYYHTQYFHFAVQSITQLCVTKMLWKDVIYWTKKVLFALTALLYCLGCFPSSWLLQTPPSPADKFTYFIIVTIIIAYYYYYYYYFSGAINKLRSISK
jgi:hypothetical protein